MLFVCHSSYYILFAKEKNNKIKKGAKNKNVGKQPLKIRNTD